ncbi:MAG: hypothetical protein M3Y82_12105, partial [Verrucomicrobiota bacterium]|nr:hypothetical protein [Verrucomicrobiota bacterium]
MRIQREKQAADKLRRDAEIKAAFDKHNRDSAAYQRSLQASKGDALLRQRDAVAQKVYAHYPRPIDGANNRIMDGKLYSKPFPAGTENFREGRDWVRDNEKNRKDAGIPIPTPEDEVAAKKEIAAEWAKLTEKKPPVSVSTGTLPKSDMAAENLKLNQDSARSGNSYG